MLWPVKTGADLARCDRPKQVTEDTECGPRLKLAGSSDTTTAVIL